MCVGTMLIFIGLIYGWRAHQISYHFMCWVTQGLEGCLQRPRVACTRTYLEMDNYQIEIDRSQQLNIWADIAYCTQVITPKCAFRLLCRGANEL
jgi:hypothetical protein